MSKFVDKYNQMFLDYIQVQPSSVSGQDNFSVWNNKRYLWNLIYSVFDLGIPDDWNMSYYRFFLFHYGRLGVFYTKKFGWVPMPFATETRDFFFFPKRMEGFNPELDENAVGIRGVNAEIIYILDDLCGLEQTVSDYAYKLAQIDKSFNVNLFNSSFALLGFAENEKDAKEIKEGYRRATLGEPLILLKKRLKDAILQNFVNAPKNQLATDELHKARRNVINDFLTEVGVRNANYEKKERLNSQEVNENNDETSAQARIILNNLKKCFEKVEAVTGGKIQLTVELNYNYEFIDSREGADEDGL